MIFCATDCTRFCLLHELLKLVVECVSSYLRLACAWPLTCYVYFCQARYSNFSLTWYRKARLRSKVGRCMICSRISEENFLISFFFFFHVPLLPSLQFFFSFSRRKDRVGSLAALASSMMSDMSFAKAAQRALGKHDLDSIHTIQTMRYVFLSL